MRLKLSANFLTVIVFAISFNTLCAQTSPCDVIQISHNPGAPLLYNSDSSKYLVNLQDTAGIFQIYVANAGDTNLTCISLNYPWSFLRPWSARNKLQVQWHESGDYIICGVEKEFYNELLFVPYNILLGWLQSGLWMDIWAVTPDGNNWYPLVYTEAGFTGPAFTPDGTKCAYAEGRDSSNLFVDVFGVWDLQLADFTVNSGVPSLTNITSIQPAGARWIEPGNFHPDGQQLLISSDIGLTNAEGQDQYILNVFTGQIVNLNNTPMVWDEHGIFSPDGNKILFMTSYPYQADTNSYHTLTIKAEFMLMNADGSGLQQLTHFRDTGYFESHAGIAATGFWTPDGRRIYCQSLIFPDYENWIIDFYGPCGNVFTSVDETQSGTFDVFPNPAQSTLTVQSPFDLTDAEITIVNTLGQTVKTITGVSGNTATVNVDDLCGGTYFIQMRSGGNYSSRIFVKEN
ncbi:MAG TPA: T9SS type A sorting domain-containing protein [Bacteroidia bacterium]|nr:T9SS type A sorting domain-containing protein [Bacteroidia bacterium]